MPIQRISPADLPCPRSGQASAGVRGVPDDVIPDFSKEATRLRAAAGRLAGIDPEDRVALLDAFARRLLDEGSDFQRRFAPAGIPFLSSFLSRTNLNRLLEASFPGGTACLRGFVDLPALGRRIMAHPRGVVVHWIAGNVPGLGLISLALGILTGNANVIKLPSENGWLLPELFARIGKIEVPKRNEGYVTGRNLLDATLFAACGREDREAQADLAREADVRVVWGGRKAVEHVERLPRRPGAQDMMFGPKASLAALGRKALTRTNRKTAAERLALDASRFDQQACSSPHVVFVERGGEVKPLEFARALAEGMGKALGRLPRPGISADEAYAVVSIRSRYLISGEVFSSGGTEWTVISSEQAGLPDPVGSRVIFVRPLEDLTDLLPHIDRRLQTLGLLMDEERAPAFAAAATSRGIERITALGQMHAYDHPWDGIFPLTRLVRWVSMHGPPPGPGPIRGG